jgi:hypothetical protein
VKRVLLIAIAFVCSAAAATQPPVTFDSPCSCHDNHGKARSSLKNDPAKPPTDANAIQAVTPSDIFSWPGPGVHLTQGSKGIAAENKWFAVTGRVVEMKVEADGDVHLGLQDVTGDKLESVVVEVPAKPKWCEIRKVLFAWTKTKLRFRALSDKTLKVNQAPVITVTGKAFFGSGSV